MGDWFVLLSKEDTLAGGRAGWTVFKLSNNVINIVIVRAGVGGQGLGGARGTLLGVSRLTIGIVVTIQCVAKVFGGQEFLAGHVVHAGAKSSRELKVGLTYVTMVIAMVVTISGRGTSGLLLLLRRGGGGGAGGGRGTGGGHGQGLGGLVLRRFFFLVELTTIHILLDLIQ